MNIFKRIYLFFYEIFHICFRHFLFPTKLGIRKIGNPGKDSPVFLSGNYTLTVYRLMRILQGIDCYLLVANSHGSNVWCAAGMNEFSEYSVIDAIRVTDLGNIVNHREIIAPPYAAPGIDTTIVQKESGFKINWGPTHLRDIPKYVKNNFRRTEDMCKVQFGLWDRMEQGIAGVTMLSINIVGLSYFFPKIIFGIIGLLVSAYFLEMLLWNILPEEKYFLRSITFTFILNLGLAGFLFFLNASLRDYLIWHSILLVICAQISSDIHQISTVYKTSLMNWIKHGNYKSLFKPIVDPNKCTGCQRCLRVCPRSILALNNNKKAVSVNPDRCIECLACVKQCKFEAIYNYSGEFKNDIKTIPNVKTIMTRDCGHLVGEKTWIGKKTIFKNGILRVVGEQLTIERETESETESEKQLITA